MNNRHRTTRAETLNALMVTWAKGRALSENINIIYILILHACRSRGLHFMNNGKPMTLILHVCGYKTFIK